MKLIDEGKRVWYLMVVFKQVYKGRINSLWCCKGNCTLIFNIVFYWARNYCHWFKNSNLVKQLNFNSGFCLFFCLCENKKYTLKKAICIVMYSSIYVCQILLFTVDINKIIIYILSDNVNCRRFYHSQATIPSLCWSSFLRNFDLMPRCPLCSLFLTLEGPSVGFSCHDNG